MYNEEDNLRPLVRELTEVLRGIQKTYEVIAVDDGSTDKSFDVLKELALKDPGLRVIRFKHNCGQTAAFDAGFKAARGKIVVTMDADLQNDPKDIPVLLEGLSRYDAVCGWRYKRNDPWTKVISSRVANFVRNKLSDEDIKDVGCSLKAFRREAVDKLKLFNGMHRFLPTLLKMEGCGVAEVKVNHRPRKYGKTKYNMRNRIFKSFRDLLAVRWMKRRQLNYEIEERVNERVADCGTCGTDDVCSEVPGPVGRV